MFTQLARPTARRRQGSVLGALLLFMACTARTTTMTDADLTNFATRYAAAWSSQDPARFAALYSEGGTLAVNGGAPSVGRGAIMATAQAYMTAFPDMRVTLAPCAGRTVTPCFTGHGPGRIPALAGRGRQCASTDMSGGPSARMACSPSRKAISTTRSISVGEGRRDPFLTRGDVGFPHPSRRDRSPWRIRNPSSARLRPVAVFVQRRVSLV